MKQLDLVLGRLNYSTENPKSANSYLNITSLNDKLPHFSNKHSSKKQIKANPKSNKTPQSSIFEPFNPSTFTDPIIQEHENKIENAKKKQKEKKASEDFYEPCLS